jgi:hypothetical protein
MDPHFLTWALTSWRWVVSFTSRPLYHRRKSPRYPLDRMLGGPQSRSGRRGENFWPYRDSNSDPLVVQLVASRYTDYAGSKKCTWNWTRWPSLKLPLRGSIRSWEADNSMHAPDIGCGLWTDGNYQAQSPMEDFCKDSDEPFGTQHNALIHKLNITLCFTTWCEFYLIQRLNLKYKPGPYYIQGIGAEDDNFKHMVKNMNVHWRGVSVCPLRSHLLRTVKTAEHMFNFMANLEDRTTK